MEPEDSLPCTHPPTPPLTSAPSRMNPVHTITYYCVKKAKVVPVLNCAVKASAIIGGEWSASRPGRFTPGERAPGIHRIGDWVDPRAGLDDAEKRQFLTLPGLELRPLSRSACSQSLYRLRYPGLLLC
jgi:hypothetical protein